MNIRMLSIVLPVFLILPASRCAAAQSQAQNTVDSIFAKGQIWELRDSGGKVFTLTVPPLDTKRPIIRPRYQGPVTLNRVPSFVIFSYDPNEADTGLITVTESAINLSQVLVCYVRNPGIIQLNKSFQGIAVNDLMDIGGPSYYARTGEKGNYKDCTLKRLR